MNLLVPLLGLLALVVLVAWTVRVVARDGLGLRPGPRSHREEIGGWVDQQLYR